VKLRYLAAALRYAADHVLGRLLPRPQWTVTWPTSPQGTYSIAIGRADSPEDAVAQARQAFAPVMPGWRIEVEAEAEVWRCKPGKPRRVAGPEYGISPAQGSTAA
jgi:hypothetical protein